ncbi:hypothetical protein HKX48_005550 [Thoreauomyces humboldtii]|nr:hypothetical protein HKX48_005550 [Thoreauomyces humboldtii]
MGKKQFIDKSKSVHYQVVHRSQRDPALADDESSKYVLKPVPPSYNLLKKGKYDAEVPDGDYPEFEERDGEYDGHDNHDFSDDEDYQHEDEEDYEGEDGQEEGDEEDDGKPVVAVSSTKSRKASGKVPAQAAPEADPSLYGIFFDDQSNYDYLKHLRPIGEDATATFMEAKGSQKKDKSGGIKFVDDDASEALTGRKVQFDIPSEALASKYEDSVGMLNRPAAPSMLDVEPDVREVMYALQDEEYVEEDIDDFFAALDADEVPEEFHVAAREAEAQAKAKEEAADAAEAEGEGAWYKDFKKYQKGVDEFSDDEDSEDEFEFDEAGNGGGKLRNPRWDRRTAETSHSVMSSSTMFRNDKLTLLDDQFDQVLGEYSDDEMGELDPEDPSVRGDNLISKGRLEDMFDEFLDATEVMGHKKRLVTKIDRMGLIDSVRGELKENAMDAIRMYEAGEGYMKPTPDDEEIEMPEAKVRDTWDVETVLSTYSNIYNRPKMISERTAAGMAPARIRLRGKLGMPVIDAATAAGPRRSAAPARGLDSQGSDEENSDDDGEEPINRGVARSKEETKEEKKMRKQELKADRRNRRVEKKATKTAFKDESKRQGKTFRNVLAQEQSLHIE